MRPKGDVALGRAFEGDGLVVNAGEDRDGVERRCGGDGIRDGRVARSAALAAPDVVHEVDHLGARPLQREQRTHQHRHSACPRAARASARLSSSSPVIACGLGGNNG